MQLFLRRNRNRMYKIDKNIQREPIGSLLLSVLYLLDLLRMFPHSYWTLICSVISYTSLISSFCTSGQMFAASFLQIPPRDGHPCYWLDASRYRACYGLAPIRECSCWANNKNPNAGNEHCDLL